MLRFEQLLEKRPGGSRPPLRGQETVPESSARGQSALRLGGAALSVGDRGAAGQPCASGGSGTLSSAALLGGTAPPERAPTPRGARQ